ncbi:uncharacterized protein [Choristoneura fumiferana]|uniref:uncharacterized protein n=1 Tax=Choristoneura fumiferana TaxID=7141 RepID=UPI003D158B3A
MDFHKFTIIITLINARKAVGVLRDFSVCHDDFSLKPPDGILREGTFTWLAFVQYVHVTTGIPHQNKAPRLVLIHQQFVVGAATDLLHLPKNYKLGNIMFGDYARDEEDCGLAGMQLKMGERCARAYLEMPFSDVTPHPEYSRFGVGNSLALVKLMRSIKSAYTIPICLPSLTERLRKRKNKIVFMVDYISSVPKDFDAERLGKKTMKLYTHKECRKHRKKTRLGSEGVTHVLCSSGCGVRPGAPIVSHNLDGQFELIGVAAGSAPCSRSSMRRRLNSEPPVYIDIYPYLTWLVNVITAHTIPLAYPQNFKLVDGQSGIGIHRSGYLRTRKVQKRGWRSRTYVTGNYCYKSLRKQARKSSMFYSEKFEVNANPAAKLHINMKISAGIETTIVCARLLLPNRLTEPNIYGVGGYNITVTFTTHWFPYNFEFYLGLAGRNTSAKDFTAWLSERQPGFW